MKLQIKALALTIGAVWAASILLVGIAHLLWPGYGGAFLDLAASIYPGFHPANGFGAVVIGSLYGLVDGAVGGAMVAWVYNRFVGV